MLECRPHLGSPWGFPLSSRGSPWGIPLGEPNQATPARQPGRTAVRARPMLGPNRGPLSSHRFITVEVPIAQQIPRGIPRGIPPKAIPAFTQDLTNPQPNPYPCRAAAVLFRNWRGHSWKGRS